MNSLARLVAARQTSTDNGSAIVEFVVIAALLLLTLFGIIQLCVYLHVRAVLNSSAAEGARYAANADIAAEMGAARTIELARASLSDSVVNRITCGAAYELSADGLWLTRVACSGQLPLFFAPAGDVLPLHVVARSLKEGR